MAGGEKRERRGAAEMIITELLASVALAAYLLQCKRLFVKIHDTPAGHGHIKLNGGFTKVVLIMMLDRSVGWSFPGCH